MLNQDQYATYRAASGVFTPGATPQDVFTITGNTNTNVYVQKMGLSTLQSTAGLNIWLITKRSSANAGGTSAAVTAVPVQSGNAAAQATVLQYTANPTAGTLIGNVWSGFVNAAATATAGVGSDLIELDFESMFGQPIALLNAAEVLGWNFSGGALPSGLIVLPWVQWFEIPKSP